ncbi:hypothetical protein ASPWEDRAFT_46543 [Aspergillus wentii DTO 134E9]|uniref:Uncharacterized protein n=1 Tax=Aspergillus wentii DTO 134E9 TaxID=1073089 RepID=A0A1L9R4E6_ASPWE|nr:uncharacterized protein ASPWEDRAFT_46543 [Aspergillus wentii DTO 134E9]OJJ29780.1 hypothetical protein ASPWEDRAFT_46543 [Aspergillus wentii DTO 134E9]
MLLDSIVDRYPEKLDHAVTLTIYKASTNNHVSLLEEILDREGKLTLGSCDSGALYFATPHEAVTRLLLQRGANPDKGGDRGMFVLEQAIHHGNSAVIRMLLDATELSPVLKPPTRGPYQVQNLLDLAAESSTPEIIQLLLSRGVDFRPENVDCHPALVNAVCGLNTDVINLFLDAGFDVNYKATSGFHKDRPLIIIPAIKGTDEGRAVVKLLLDRGAQIDMMDESDRTALSWAAQHRNKTVVEELLARGADPLLKDVNNKTPLHWAAFDGGRVVTRIILKALESRGIRFDRLERLISNLEKDSRFDRDLILKQLRQHRWRMMYPCP